MHAGADFTTSQPFYLISRKDRTEERDKNGVHETASKPLKFLHPTVIVIPLYPINMSMEVPPIKQPPENHNPAVEKR